MLLIGTEVKDLRSIWMLCWPPKTSAQKSACRIIYRVMGGMPFLTQPTPSKRWKI